MDPNLGTPVLNRSLMPDKPLPQCNQDDYDSMIKRANIRNPIPGKAEAAARFLYKQGLLKGTFQLPPEQTTKN